MKLPSNILKQNMKAIYKHGMLEIQFEKKKPTRIEIE
jgi:HSP20 family protein